MLLAARPAGAGPLLEHFRQGKAFLAERAERAALERSARQDEVVKFETVLRTLEVSSESELMWLRATLPETSPRNEKLLEDLRAVTPELDPTRVFFVPLGSPFWSLCRSASGHRGCTVRAAAGRRERRVLLATLSDLYGQRPQWWLEDLLDQALRLQYAYTTPPLADDAMLEWLVSQQVLLDRAELMPRLMKRRDNAFRRRYKDLEEQGGLGMNPRRVDADHKLDAEVFDAMEVARGAADAGRLDDAKAMLAVLDGYGGGRPLRVALKRGDFRLIERFIDLERWKHLDVLARGRVVYPWLEPVLRAQMRRTLTDAAQTQADRAALRAVWEDVRLRLAEIRWWRFAPDEERDLKTWLAEELSTHIPEWVKTSQTYRYEYTDSFDTFKRKLERKLGVEE